jgi:hypothetical protein
VIRMDRSNTGQPETRGVGRSYRVDQAAELWRDCVGISLSIPKRQNLPSVAQYPQLFGQFRAKWN